MAEKDAKQGYKTILFTTDFSDISKKTFAHALSMAKLCGARLYIFHVVDTSGEAAGFYLPHLAFEKLEEEMKAAAEAMIKKVFSKKLGSFKDYELQVRMGTPNKEIARFAEENNVDLIVMGTYSRGGIDRLLFGSTTDRVIRKVKCPVLAIPPAR